MKPLTLVQLRCPQRCLLGLVVATSDGPQVILRERALVDLSETTTRAEVHELGPVPLDEPVLTYGCRHAANAVASDQQRRDLVTTVRGVQRGDAQAGLDFTLMSTQIE